MIVLEISSMYETLVLDHMLLHFAWDTSGQG